MTRRKGTLEIYNPHRSLICWLIWGWWWRLIKIMLAYLIADILGFRKLRIRR